MNPRFQATQVLTAVLREKCSLTEALARHNQDGTAEERSFVAAMSYGVMRYLVPLEHLLGQLLSKGLRAKDSDVKAALLLGLYQLRHSQRPAHASVNETVSLAKPMKKAWAKGLINAVLRNYQRQQEDLEKAIQAQAAVQQALPEWLFKRLQTAYPSDYAAIAEVLLEQAPMTLRVNPQHDSAQAYLETLQAAGIAAQSDDELQTAVTLEKPCDVDRLPGFYEGHCSVQDRSAQWAAYLLPLQPHQRILDACSAPGGKGAACLERLDNKATLHSLDIDPERQKRTEATFSRLKLEAKVLVGDLGTNPDWWDQELYDAILLDVPCSATGVIRRHPDIKFFRRPSDIRALTVTQAKLLREAWKLLKIDGHLLYATCSVLPEENSAIIQAFLKETGNCVELALPSISGTLKGDSGLQFLPQSEGQDGFYYALLKKTNEPNA